MAPTAKFDDYRGNEYNQPDEDAILLYGENAPKKEVMFLLGLSKIQKEQDYFDVNGFRRKLKGVQIDQEERKTIRRNLQIVANYFGMSTFHNKEDYTKSHIFILQELRDTLYRGFVYGIEYFVDSKGNNFVIVSIGGVGNLSIENIKVCNSKFAL